MSEYQLGIDDYLRQLRVRNFVFLCKPEPQHNAVLLPNGEVRFLNYYEQFLGDSECEQLLNSI